jgi:hypothetical protein
MDTFEIQSRLKFISKVQIGDKINVKFMIIQKDCFSTKLSRTLYYENRITTLNFIRDNINRALEIITKSCCQRDKELTTNLVIDLKQSKIGIENLRQTYIDDVKFCCDLNTILQNIDIKITDCEKIVGIVYNSPEIEIDKSVSHNPHTPKSGTLDFTTPQTPHFAHKIHNDNDEDDV